MFDRSLRRFAVTACCVATLLTGCGSPSQPNLPSTSELSNSSASPSSPDDLAREAERVFRRIDAIHNSHVFAGIYEPFPEELVQLTTDPYLSLSRDKYRENAAKKIVLKNVDAGFYELKRFSGELEHNAAVVLEGCADFTKVETYQDGQFMGYGGISHEKYFFRSEGGKLKLFGISSKPVTSCSLA